MDFTSSRIPYRQTNSFSKIAIDYIDQSLPLQTFYEHPVSITGIQKAIQSRTNFSTDRILLVKELNAQYKNLPIRDAVNKNIQSIASDKTFTITTAHQNNIFTGPVFFIYKILHVIRLADHLNSLLPGFHFVPVYFMGSEDADLDELNHIYLGGEKLVWNTKQTGAVGRMKVDKQLIQLVEKISGELSVLPFGKEAISIFRDAYQEGISIQDATMQIVHQIFGERGLLIFMPDNPSYKQKMDRIFEDELFRSSSSSIVEKSVKELENAGYKAQAQPREINLFYLSGDIRRRIIRRTIDDKKETEFIVHDTEIKFTEGEMRAELKEHPERFSPNVILRGLYQELMLPNLAFIGGGGELAYWLQYKSLFSHYTIPFPVLILRNSFLVVEARSRSRIAKLGFTIEDFFADEETLINKLISRQSPNKLELNGKMSETERLYEEIKSQATGIDPTLGKHVEALRAKTLNYLEALQKKMFRAEKRKFSDQQRQIREIKNQLFPNKGLQERSANILSYYAQWGSAFNELIYDQSPALEQEFTIVSETE